MYSLFTNTHTNYWPRYISINFLSRCRPLSIDAHETIEQIITKRICNTIFAALGTVRERADVHVNDKCTFALDLFLWKFYIFVDFHNNNTFRYLRLADKPERYKIPNTFAVDFVDNAKHTKQPPRPTPPPSNTTTTTGLQSKRACQIGGSRNEY